MSNKAETLDTLVDASVEIHARRTAKLGFGANTGALGKLDHPGELLGRALISAGLEKNIGLGQHGVVAERRVGIALDNGLVLGGRF